VFSKSKEDKDPRWVVGLRASPVAYLLLSDSFIEHTPKKLEEEIGRLTEGIEGEPPSAILWLSTSMQGTNCSTLATLQRDIAHVLAFVESQTSAQDRIDGRMERESKSFSV
jgi:hypothetical protein